jgi:hypothetical protein
VLQEIKSDCALSLACISSEPHNAALQMAEGRIENLKVNTQASSSGYLTFTHTSNILGAKGKLTD